MTHRTSLREFQEQLSRRIAQAASVAREAVRLCVLAGADGWMVELPDVGEVAAVPELTPVPRTQPWFRGIANVRGALFSVVDLAAFLGHEPAALLHQDSKLLLIGQRYRTNAAILVDRVLGLRKLTEFSPDPVSTGSASSPWEGEAYLDADGRRWRHLEVAALLSAEDFLRVGA